MEFVLKEFNIELTVDRIANLHYFEFTSNFETRKDRHPFRELVYVDSGILEVRSKHYSGLLEQNQMIIHEADESHSLLCPIGSAPNVIIIGMECAETRLNRFAERPVTLDAPLSKLLAEIVKEGRAVFLPPYNVPNLADMKKRPNSLYGADQLLKILLEYFLIRLIRESEYRISIENEEEPSSPFIREVENYLRQNYREKITIDELAFLFGTNRSSLCKAFREQTKMTIIEFVNRQRIEAAKKMMREGGKNFAQISDELNFPTQAYFTRLFQKTEGLSPSRYIKTIKSALND